MITTEPSHENSAPTNTEERSSTSPLPARNLLTITSPPTGDMERASDDMATPATTDADASGMVSGSNGSHMPVNSHQQTETLGMLHDAMSGNAPPTTASSNSSTELLEPVPRVTASQETDTEARREHGLIHTMGSWVHRMLETLVPSSTGDSDETSAAAEPALLEAEEHASLTSSGHTDASNQEPVTEPARSNLVRETYLFTSPEPGERPQSSHIQTSVDSSGPSSQANEEHHTNDDESSSRIRQEHDASGPVPPSSPHESESETPHFLIYIPVHASPFPFPILYDANTSIALPVLDRVEQSNPDDPNIPPRVVRVLGTPFHLSFRMRPSEPHEAPDPERAAAYVKELEHVDSELRARMGPLGLSDIGVYGCTAEDPKQKYVVGCGICLEPYDTDDKPAWFVGEDVIERESVVVVPCAGLHTVHAGCLQSWLASKPPSQWTCPFCRARLPSSPNASSANMGSLRDLVRSKEREAGWRCDAPACIPMSQDGMKRGPLVQLYPCRHEIHLDCLCTSMRVERADANGFYDGVSESTDEDDDEEPDTDYDTWMSSSAPALASSVHSDLGLEGETVGKWVTCAACRHDAWAQLPTRPWPKRVRQRAT